MGGISSATAEEQCRRRMEHGRSSFRWSAEAAPYLASSVIRRGTHLFMLDGKKWHAAMISAGASANWPRSAGLDVKVGGGLLVCVGAPE